MLGTFQSSLLPQVRGTLIIGPSLHLKYTGSYQQNQEYDAPYEQKHLSKCLIFTCLFSDERLLTIHLYKSGSRLIGDYVTLHPPDIGTVTISTSSSESS